MLRGTGWVSKISKNEVSSEAQSGEQKQNLKKGTAKELVRAV